MICFLLCSTLVHAQDYQYEAYEYKTCTSNDGWSGRYPSNAQIFININKRKVFSNILPGNLELIITNVKKEAIRGQNVTRIQAYNVRNKNDKWQIRHCVFPNGNVSIYFDREDITLLYYVKKRKWTVEW